MKAMKTTVTKWLLVSLAIVACQKKEPIGTQLLSADSVYARKRIDPHQIEFSVGKVEVKEKFPGSKHTVPKVEINFRVDNIDHQADFYQVQRCHESVVLQTSDGKDPTNPHNYDGANRLGRIRDYLHVWGSATTDMGGCRFLDGVHVSNPFIDIVVGSGSFYYLIRPCIMAKHSVYGNKRTCHYKFYKTEVVNYTDTLGNKMRQTRSQLSEYATELEFTYAQIGGVMKEMAGYLQTCEFNEAQKIAAKRRLAGIVKVALTVNAAIVATVVSGPQSAFAAGSLAIKLGDKMFSGISNATPNCPTGNYTRQISDLQDRAEQTVFIIGQLRQKLDGLTFDADTEPLEHTWIYQKIAQGDATHEDLIKWMEEENEKKKQL